MKNDVFTARGFVQTVSIEAIGTSTIEEPESCLPGDKCTVRVWCDGLGYMTLTMGASEARDLKVGDEVSVGLIHHRARVSGSGTSPA